MLIFSVTLEHCSDNPVSNGFWKTPLGALRLTIRSLDTSCPFRKRQIWKTIALCSIFLSLYISKIPPSQLFMARMLFQHFDRGSDPKFEVSYDITPITLSSLWARWCIYCWLWRHIRFMVEQLVFAFQHFQITHLLFKHDDEDPCWGSFCFLLPQSQRPYEMMMMLLLEVPSALPISGMTHCPFFPSPAFSSSPIHCCCPTTSQHNT